MPLLKDRQLKSHWFAARKVEQALDRVDRQGKYARLDFRYLGATRKPGEIADTFSQIAADRKGQKRIVARPSCVDSSFGRSHVTETYLVHSDEEGDHYYQATFVSDGRQSGQGILASLGQAFSGLLGRGDVEPQIRVKEGLDRKRKKR